MVNAEGRAFLQPQEDWKRVGKGSVGGLGRVSQGLTQGLTLRAILRANKRSC